MQFLRKVPVNVSLFIAVWPLLSACGGLKGLGHHDRSAKQEDAFRSGSVVAVDGLAQPAWQDEPVERRCEALKEFTQKYAAQYLAGVKVEQTCDTSIYAGETYMYAVTLSNATSSIKILDKADLSSKQADGPSYCAPASKGCSASQLSASRFSNPSDKIFLEFHPGMRDFPATLNNFTTAVPAKEPTVYGVAYDEYKKQVIAKLPQLKLPMTKGTLALQATSDLNNAAGTAVKIAAIDDATLQDGFLGCQDRACLDSIGALDGKGKLRLKVQGTQLYLQLGQSVDLNKAFSAYSLEVWSLSKEGDAKYVSSSSSRVRSL